MIRRHPHVFGDTAVTSARQALAQWEAIKQSEARDAGRVRSVLEGVPRSLPSLLRAQRLQSKAARIGFDWPDAAAAWQKVREELGEVETALAQGDRARIQEELGDVFFSVVNVARLCEIDAEEALQGAVEKFRRRFTQMEADLTARGKDTATVTAEELERLWQAVKAANTVGVSRPDEAQSQAGQCPRRTRRHHGLGSGRDRQRRQLHAGDGNGRRRRDQAQGGRHHRGGRHAPGADRGRRGGAHHRGEPPRDPRHSRGRPGPDLKADATKIGAATKSALQLAEKHRITSIAFPALGTGVGGFPPAKAADAMVTTVLDHLKGGTSSLKRVVFVLYQDEAYKAFTMC